MSLNAWQGRCVCILNYHSFFPQCVKPYNIKRPVRHDSISRFIFYSLWPKPCAYYLLDTSGKQCLNSPGRYKESFPIYIRFVLNHWDYILACSAKIFHGMFNAWRLLIIFPSFSYNTQHICFLSDTPWESELYNIMVLSGFPYTVL